LKEINGVTHIVNIKAFKAICGKDIPTSGIRESFSVESMREIIAKKANLGENICPNCAANLYTFDEIEYGRKYIHIFNGEIYTPIKPVMMQFLDEWIDAVEYQNEKGQVFVRSLNDFKAKFKPVSD